MNNKRSLEAEWAGFSEDVPPYQFINLRAAFYAGAYAMYSLIFRVHHWADHDDEVRYYEKLREEALSGLEG